MMYTNVGAIAHTFMITEIGVVLWLHLTHNNAKGIEINSRWHYFLLKMSRGSDH